MPFAPEHEINEESSLTNETFFTEGRRSSMPARFVDLDRQTPMFLPYDLRDWVPASPIVHFILDAVEQLPMTNFGVNERGSGSEQYPQKPRGCGVKSPTEPLPGRKTGPVSSESDLNWILLRPPPPQNHFLGLTHCHA
jgi:hypothetical protein